MSRYPNIKSIVIFLLLGLVIGACRPGEASQDSPNTPQQVATITQSSGYADALSLYASDIPRLSDTGFQRITDFYGVKRIDMDVKTTRLTDALLRDPSGAYIPMIYIDAQTLLKRLDREEWLTIEQAVDKGGADILISALQDTKNAGVYELTDGEIRGSVKPQDHHQDYLISKDFPELTHELTGITVTYKTEQLDSALTLAPKTQHTNIIVQSTDDQGAPYPIFADYKRGKGHVFVISNDLDSSIKFNRLEWHYLAKRVNKVFEQQWFGHIVPMMMFVRFAAGDRAWHNNHHYANFTLDDPPFQKSAFDYAGVLKEAIDHNFHFTLAMPPKYYDQSEQSVVDLFRSYPDRLSVVQHGNNHDSYEFYKYTVDANDTHHARPLVDQEADIVEGRTRMGSFAQRTGVPYTPIMIFPFNVAPAPTLALLKQYNFQSTINSLDVPLGDDRVNSWDSYMYPAELAYKGFALMSRGGPGSRPYPFDLFIDHPILLYGHKDLFDKNGIGALNPIADAINSVPGKVEWRSLDYIMKHLYLEKKNQDNSIDVMFFGNDIIIKNESNDDNVYHITKKEDLSIPIYSVSVDNKSTDYTVVSDTFRLDLAIPRQSSREIRIMYGSPNKDFSISQPDLTVDTGVASGTISAVVHNHGSAGGPVSVEFFDGDPELGGTSLGIATVIRIDPNAAGTAKIRIGTLQNDTICAVADPYNIILESDKTNNKACSK